MAMEQPTLYLVPTPIGNLGDMTLRGLETLKNVDLIAAEDTRRTRTLLSHFDIHTPLLSYHEHNAVQRREELLARLAEGQSLAVVSDAGTPGLSDPGADIAREAAAAGFCVVALPGASALLPALTGSGLDSSRFVFEGFLPRPASERRARLALLAAETRTMVFYISPHRCATDLKDLLHTMGNRPATLCRELTKVYETFYRQDLAKLVELAAEPLKGEMVLVVAGGQPENRADDPATLRAELQALLDQGQSAKDAARTLAQQSQTPRNQLYALALEIKKTDNNSADG